MIELVDLGAASVDKATGALLVQCRGAKLDEDGTTPDYGEVPFMCALGLTAVPFGATPEGTAQAVVVDMAGFSGIAIAGRDTRTAKIVGKAQPGDTILHSTGPAQAAQLQLKEIKRLAALLTKTSGGKTLMIVLDGVKEQIQITHAGAMIEMRKNGDMSILNGDGAGFQIQGGNVHVIGNLVAGAGNGPLCYALCTPAGYAPGGIVAAKGITPGV